MALKPYDLRRRLYVIFRGEEGLDYGGLARYSKKNLWNLKIVFINQLCFPVCQHWMIMSNSCLSSFTLHISLSPRSDQHSSPSPLSFILFYLFISWWLVLQGMVLLTVPWSAEPHVLSVWVRWQEQLLSADQPGLGHQPGPPLLLLLHRSLHSNGTFTRKHTPAFCRLRGVMLSNHVRNS